MKIFNDFIVSREKISRESIRVDDLYFTPNCENVKEKLDEIIKITDDNFPNIYDINRKTVSGLIHIFNGNPTNTKFYMAALSLIENRGKRFQIIHDTRIGAYIQLKDVVKKKEETLEEEVKAVEQKEEIAENKEEAKAKDDKTPKEEIVEQKEDAKVEITEIPKEEVKAEAVEQKEEIVENKEEAKPSIVEDKAKTSAKNRKQQKAIDDAKAEI